LSAKFNDFASNHEIKDPVVVVQKE